MCRIASCSTPTGTAIAPVATRAWVDQVFSAHPTREFDQAWGTGFIDPESFVRIVYRSLVAERRDAGVR